MMKVLVDNLSNSWKLKKAVKLIFFMEHFLQKICLIIFSLSTNLRIYSKSNHKSPFVLWSLLLLLVFCLARAKAQELHSSCLLFLTGIDSFRADSLFLLFGFNISHLILMLATMVVFLPLLFLQLVFTSHCELKTYTLELWTPILKQPNS